VSLATTHKEYIIDQVLKEYLYQGVIPTSDQLEEALDTYQDTHPNLSQPVSKYKDFTLEKGSYSSASAVQEAAEVFDQDIGVILRELRKLVQTNRRFYERWSYELQRLVGKATKLNHRITSLLMLREDTAGYFAHIEDVFSDMALIDTENTTARVDIRETQATINPGVVHPSGGYCMINLTGLTEDDVSFSPLSKRAGISHSIIGSSRLSNLFKQDKTMWQHEVICSSGGPMSCELKVRASRNKDLEVSKVVFDFKGTTGGDSTITCQYSADGYTWYLVPTDSATTALIPVSVWQFPLTKLRWIKLIITKGSHDSQVGESFRYGFTSGSMQLMGQTYTEDDGNTLITKSLEAEAPEGEAVYFSRVALEACEKIEKGSVGTNSPRLVETNIKYYVSASKDDSTWTDWFGIMPYNRETEEIVPKSVNFGGTVESDNLKDTDIEKFDTSSTDITSAMTLVTDSSTVGVKFTGPDQAVVNTSIGLATDANPSAVANSIILWRNVHYVDWMDPFGDRRVREVPAGWGYDNGYYTCCFEVVSSSGARLDLGDRECILDDSRVSGVVKIPKGIHKFRTLADNWYNLDEPLIEAGITSITNEATLKEVDKLYPYNHKLIIEGFPYVDAFTGEKIYSGMDIVAQYYAKKTSLFDLENNVSSDDYGWFSVRSITDETDPALAVVLHYDSNVDDYANEYCRLKWRSSTAAGTLYRYIKLKAVLSTTDSGRTPSLTSYRLKLAL